MCLNIITRTLHFLSWVLWRVTKDLLIALSGCDKRSCAVFSTFIMRVPAHQTRELFEPITVNPVNYCANGPDATGYEIPGPDGGSRCTELEAFTSTACGD